MIMLFSEKSHLTFSDVIPACPESLFPRMLFRNTTPDKRE